MGDVRVSIPPSEEAHNYPTPVMNLNRACQGEEPPPPEKLTGRKNEFSILMAPENYNFNYICNGYYKNDLI